MNLSKIINAMQTFAAAVKDRVSIFVPKTPGDSDPNVFIGINGRNYILPKGKTSSVPAEVAAEYERAMRAAHYCDDHINRLIEQKSKNAEESKKTAVSNG